MINTTLCYIEKDDCYLMLLRNRKHNDLNEGKWIGVGGKFEEGEDCNSCLLREVYEETGLRLKEYTLRGLVKFYSDRWEAENMYLYTATSWTGELNENCSEGELRWIPVKDIPSLNLWEGDRLFMEALSKGKNDIALSLYYEGDTLKKAVWH